MNHTVVLNLLSRSKGAQIIAIARKNESAAAAIILANGT